MGEAHGRDDGDVDVRSSIGVCYVVVRSPRNYYYGSRHPGARIGHAHAASDVYKRVAASIVGRHQDRGSTRIAQGRGVRGGSFGGCRARGGVQLTDQGHHSAAEVDHPVHCSPMVGRQRFEREQLRFGEQRSERIVDGVTQIEGRLAGGSELFHCIPCCRAPVGSFTHGVPA